MVLRAVKTILLLLAGLTLFLATAASARAGIAWAESTQGDLSDDASAPTTLSFGPGANLVSGTMGSDAPGTPPDRDIFTFTLGADQTLTSILFTVFTPVNQSFYAIAAGVGIDTNSAEHHLANTLVKRTNENILLNLAFNSYSGGTGLDVPLGPGTYTVWFQEISSVVTYSTTYTVAVTPVPEPAVAVAGGMLSLLGLACLLRRRRAAGAS